MRHICGECGRVIEDGADFCYGCGATLKYAYRLDDDGCIYTDSTEGGVVRCPVCGADNARDAEKCAVCGSSIAASGYMPLRPHKLDTREKLALVLSLVLGVLYIFGIGYLVLGKWSRAVSYMCISAILLYIRWFTPGITTTEITIIGVVGFIFYFRQFIDIFREIYLKPAERRPPGNNEGGA